MAKTHSKLGDETKSATPNSDVDISDVGEAPDPQADLADLVVTPSMTGLLMQQKPRVTRQVCGACLNWRPASGQSAFGQCLISGKALHAPLVTTDLMSCSKWEFKG